MYIVQLREGCDDGREVEAGEQPNVGQVVQSQQAAHHRLSDSRHLEAVQQGGGDNSGTTWVDNKCNYGLNYSTVVNTSG